jgi:hypothetical protein
LQAVFNFARSLQRRRDFEFEASIAAQTSRFIKRIVVMRSVEKVEVRELSASEIKAVSGGGYVGNTTPLPPGLFHQTPKPPKPYQG